MKKHRPITRTLILVGLLFFALISFNSYQSDKSLLEKIYTQTDRPFYFPGETIWFKSYIVSSDHTISNLSDLVHAELISPKGAVVTSRLLSIDQGYAYGDFHIDNDWAGGIYTLKVYTNWMRNYGEEAFFTKQITVQKVVQPNLLLNLKFQKEGYGKSSEVITDFEVKDLKNNPLAHKEMTFEVTLKGQSFLKEKFMTDADGKAHPRFKLPENLETADVILNVLIPYQGTTESISRAVPVVLDTIDLQFFPESGQMISGTTNTIALKALNEFGKPVDVSGQILDKNLNVVADFKSFHDGMGSFKFLVKPDQVYYARIMEPFKSDRNIPLPDVHNNGVKFSVETDSLNTKIDLFSTLNETLFLEVRNSSKTLMSQTIGSNEKYIEFNTAHFPMGIATFSIKNTNQDILAERLVFMNAHKQLKVTIALEKDIYDTREKMCIKIKTRDANNTPIPSNLSLSVADNKLLSFADDKQDHILSSLLISSELKGKLHKPHFYLNPKEPKSGQALDYVMLTHGWRNYIRTPTVTAENAAFLPEQSAVQNGIVLDRKGNPKKANLFLFDEHGDKVLVFETKENGTFSFKFNKNRSLVLIAYADDGETLTIKNTDFKNAQLAQGINSINQENKTIAKRFEKSENPLKKTITQNAIATISLTEDSAALDEVVVVGYGYHNKEYISGALTVVRAEALMRNGSIINALQGNVAGIQVIQNAGQPGNASKISIRGMSSISGNHEPLLIVDGVPYDQNTFANLDANQVNSVTVLKDAAATSLYGSRAANGVILVGTKNAHFYNNYGKRRLNNANYNNYAVQQYYNYNTPNTYSSKQFYVPKYDSNYPPEERTDFRQTIYWNPVVQTDANGEAQLEYYNSDAITSFKIVAEGIGFNGLIGRAEETYATKKMLAIDFKAPNYMTLNDTVILPITITNESDQTISADFKINLPEHLKLVGSIEKKILVEAKSSIIRNISVIPIKKGEKIRLSFELQSKEYSDTVNREVAIVSPYFPTEMSLSGSQSQAFEFDLNNVVEGSLEAEFNIYTDVVGDVMNGIEGMISKPYGCFEQTSSATYPNIMVLQYLKASGKSNPDIESKAMDYIKEGYKRLISYETSEGGFEWFGHTPPHETLTAYGILEFTEMKQLYNGVDQKMIDRTVNWLLGRKDGKGGFKKSDKGYDSFASSPSDVANAYIVYALSEAKIEASLELEYNSTYKDALHSNDSYKMALLAMASHNLGNQENFNVLIKKIKANISEYRFNGLPVQNTITRSYGDSKTIETTALTLLALMRENQPDDTLIAKGIEYLVSKRKGGTFGSTQATVMALKVLINYTVQQNQKIISSNEVVELIINGSSIKTKLEINAQGRITLNGLEKHIKEGKQTAKVIFNTPENSYPYALNLKWDSTLPNSSEACPMDLKTELASKMHKVGDNVSMTIKVSNTKNEPTGMTIAMIGIPSGTTPQPWQLKKILDENQAAYYEIFDNYLVFYWSEFRENETKILRLDLKADIAGTYKAPASNVYLFYGDEDKIWISGNDLVIGN